MSLAGGDSLTTSLGVSVQPRSASRAARSTLEQTE